MNVFVGLWMAAIALICGIIGVAPASAELRLGAAASSTAAATSPEYKAAIDRLSNAVMCTGAEGRMYYTIGQAVSAALQASSKATKVNKLEVAITTGSVDNLKLVSANECQVAFVESGVIGSDQPGVITAVKGWNEVLHIIVPVRTKIDSVSDITPDKLSAVYVGGIGSGGERMFSMMRATHPGLKNINVVNGSIDTTMFAALESGNVAVVIVGAVTDRMIGQFGARSNTRPKNDQYKLISVPLTTLVSDDNPGLKKLYKPVTLKSNWMISPDTQLYGNMIRSGVFGSGGVDTVAVTADIVLSNQFAADLKLVGAYEAFVSAVRTTIDNNGGVTGAKFFN